MKVQEVVFKKPVRVIQVFRKINFYGKTTKSFEDRKDDTQWLNIFSKSGYVKDKELWLPEQVFKNPNFEICTLITLEDNSQSQFISGKDLISNKTVISNNAVVYNNCFYLSRESNIDIFEIKGDSGIELHLNYNYSEVGVPRRDNFKLCDIKLNKPVEVKINGKTDFSFTSRGQRLFKEQEYIFEYLGDFSKCFILIEPYDPINKKIPENRKVVDLLKQLW